MQDIEVIYGYLGYLIWLLLWKDPLASWSATEISGTGKGCLREFLHLVCMSIDVHGMPRYNRKTKQNKTKQKNQPNKQKNTLPPLTCGYRAVPFLRVTFDMKLVKLLSPAHLFLIIQWLLTVGTFTGQPSCSWLLTSLLPWKELRQFGDCPPFQSFPKK